jgi:tRNA dimethylallyltransferase
VDPSAAAKIDPRNLRRTVRAWEVILTSGQRFSKQAAQGRSPYHACQIGLTLSRQELYSRVDARIEMMFAKGYSPALPSMSGIGYSECAAVLRGDMTIEEAKVRMRRRTHALVRRQSNWFKEGDPAIHWYHANNLALEHVESFIRRWLSPQAASV